jgi:hypothetical protein
MGYVIFLLRCNSFYFGFPESIRKKAQNTEQIVNSMVSGCFWHELLESCKLSKS